MRNICNRYFGLVAFFVTQWVAACNSLPTQKGSEPMGLVFLGNTEGKSFFAENTQYAVIKTNWNESNSACRASGMRLASITSDAQANLLKNAYNSATFSGDYWTGGRDALSMQQVVWDSNKQEPTSRYVPLAVYVDIQSCLMYTAKSSPYLALVPCGNLYGKICEAVS